jgi:hypothetical protein
MTLVAWGDKGVPKVVIVRCWKIRVKKRLAGRAGNCRSKPDALAGG